VNALAMNLGFNSFLRVLFLPIRLQKLPYVSVASVVFIIIAIVITPPNCLAQSNLVDRPKRTLLFTLHLNELSADNRELAEQLELWPMLIELYDIQKPPGEERRRILRQKIRETIFECYFDAASVQGEALRELGLLEAQRETVITRRDRSIEINNATNFIAAGTLNTIGSALGFTNRLPPFPGNFNQMLSGVVAASMSMYSLKQADGSKIRGQGHPTLIAELFGRPYDERTSYPESVWRFLHGNSPEDLSKTRIQLLEERWITRHRLEKHGSKREKLKLDLVCGLSTSKKLMTLDDLNDQISVIGDIDAIVALMSHHLRDLLSLIDSDVLEVQSPVNIGNKQQTKEY
jgi:hypothetical protein